MMRLKRNLTVKELLSDHLIRYDRSDKSTYDRLFRERLDLFLPIGLQTRRGRIYFLCDSRHFPGIFWAVD